MKRLVTLFSLLSLLSGFSLTWIFFAVPPKNSSIIVLFFLLLFVFLCSSFGFAFTFISHRKLENPKVAIPRIIRRSFLLSLLGVGTLLLYVWRMTTPFHLLLFIGGLFFLELFYFRSEKR